MPPENCGIFEVFVEQRLTDINRTAQKTIIIVLLRKYLSTALSSHRTESSKLDNTIRKHLQFSGREMWRVQFAEEFDDKRLLDVYSTKYYLLSLLLAGACKSKYSESS